MASLLRKRSGHGLQPDKSDFSIPPSSTLPQMNGGHMAAKSAQFPPKTRTRQRNRESIDLDEVMAGSDDEESPTPPPKTPVSPGPNKFKVSASARELMDFLDAGPPDDLAPPSKASRDLVDFLNSAPPPPDRPFPNNSVSSQMLSKKASGRLQKMMSRLSINQSDRRRTNSISQHEEAKFRGIVPSAAGGENPTLNNIRRIISKPSLSSLVPSPIIPKQPVPPRPHISPPESPLRISPVDGSQSPLLRTRQPSRVSPWEEPPLPPSPKRRPSEPMLPSTPVDSPVAVMTSTNGVLKKPPHGRRASYVARVPVPYTKVEQDELVSSSQRSINSSIADGRTTPRSEVSKTIDAFPIPPRTVEVMPAGLDRKGEQPCISSETAYAIRKMLRNASNVDECRVIFDLFMARSGIPRADPERDVSIPSASANNDIPLLNGNAESLERSVVGCLLGGEEDHA